MRGPELMVQEAAVGLRLHFPREEEKEAQPEPPADRLTYPRIVHPGPEEKRFYIMLQK